MLMSTPTVCRLARPLMLVRLVASTRSVPVRLTTFFIHATSAALTSVASPVYVPDCPVVPPAPVMQALPAQVVQPELAPLWSLPKDTLSVVLSAATAQLDSAGLPAMR